MHFNGGPPLPLPFVYDGKGNLTNGNIANTGGWAFTYDAENRMLTANKTDATVAASYAYDPLGRRNHKSGTGVTERYFLDDGDDELQEYDGSKNVVALYVPGPAIDEPIVMSVPNGNGTYRHEYFHTNHQGSVIAMSDDSGALVEGQYTYDPYGNCFAGSNPCSTGVPYRFTGRRLDTESGLYYYRARYYAPSIGRFMQTDPVGYTADLNLYTYVGNDPVGRTDPTGQMDDFTFDAYAQAVSQMSPQEQAGLAVAGVVISVGGIVAIAAVEGGGAAAAGAVTVGGGVGAKALAPLSKAERMSANAAQGRAGNAATEAKLGDKVAGKEVSFKTSDQTRTRTDFVTKDKGVVETKTGNAQLSKGQQKLHEDIKAGRPVTPVGQNAAKAGLEPGKPTTMTSCTVDRPC